MSSNRPFEPGTSGAARLAEMFAVPNVPDAYPCVALITGWGGVNSHGEEFPMNLARSSADELWASLPRDAGLMLAGLRVARAFGVDPHYFRWQSVWRATGAGHESIVRDVVVIPHPGNARWWSEHRNLTRARRFFGTVRKES